MYDPMNVSIEANGVGPDRTAPTEAVLSWSALFVKDASRAFHQVTCVVRSPSSSPNDVALRAKCPTHRS